MFSEQKLAKSMEALKNGNDSSFDIIYEETHRLVYYIIYAIVKDHELSEDIMQDVYMKVYEKIKTYTASPKAWIGAIARNLAINAYHKQQKELTITYDVADEIILNQETPLINLASQILPEDEFLILMLCVCEGYKRKEVAKITGLSISGVTWKLQQALEKVKKEVQK